MKAYVLALGVVLSVFATGSQLHAQCYYPLIPPAPDACWGGYYQQNNYGQWYGPSYYVYPPFPPFQGMLPAPPRPAVPPGMPGYQPGMPPRPGLVAVPGGQPTMQMPPAPYGYGGTVAFPSHQWARSPRDFFMVD